MKRTIESISLSITFLLFALTLFGLYFKDVAATDAITGRALFLVSFGILSIVLFILFSLSVLVPPIYAKYEEWFRPPFKSSVGKWVGFAVFITLWIAIFINFLSGFLPAINELPEFLRPTAVHVAVWWPAYVALALAINLVEIRWRILSSLWQALKQIRPIRVLASELWALLLKHMKSIAKDLTEWGKKTLRPLRSRLTLGVSGVVVIVAATVFGVTWMSNNYRSGEFYYEFTANILATLIGVIIGVLSAIIITLFVINPYIKHKEEKRLEPLRRPTLMFWDHTLTLYTTSLLMDLDFPEEITRAISNVSSQVVVGMDSLADEEKLVELERLLLESDIREEAVVRSLIPFKDTLEEYKDFLLRMHDTVVALPYIFKETPEVASGVEMLVGNFLSGLTMMEYKTQVENNIKTTRLNFYSTSIIKMTGRQAFALVRAIRRARLEHQ